MTFRQWTLLVVLVLAGCAGGDVAPTVSYSGHHHVRNHEFSYNQFWRRDVKRWRNPGPDVCRQNVRVPASFVRYAPPDAHLKVNMPSTPVEVVRTAKRAGVNEEVVTVRGKVEYLASHSVPLGIPPRRFDVPITVSTNMAHELNGRITRSAPIQCQGFQGLDFTIEFDEEPGELRGRAFYAPDSLFLVVAAIHEQSPLPSEATLFVEAFRPKG